MYMLKITPETINSLFRKETVIEKKIKHLKKFVENMNRYPE